MQGHFIITRRRAGASSDDTTPPVRDTSTSTATANSNSKSNSELIPKCQPTDDPEIRDLTKEMDRETDNLKSLIGTHAGLLYKLGRVMHEDPNGPLTPRRGNSTNRGSSSATGGALALNGYDESGNNAGNTISDKLNSTLDSIVGTLEHINNAVNRNTEASIRFAEAMRTWVS